MAFFFIFPKFYVFYGFWDGDLAKRYTPYYFLKNVWELCDTGGRGQKMVVPRMAEAFLAEKYMSAKQGFPYMAEYRNWLNHN